MNGKSVVRKVTPKPKRQELTTKELGKTLNNLLYSLVSAGGANLLPNAVKLRQLPRRQDRRCDQQKTGGEVRSVQSLCCIATEVFFANDGAVSRLRCRSKVAQKVALHLWNAPTSPNPSRQPNRRRIGFLTDDPTPSLTWDN